MNEEEQRTILKMVQDHKVGVQDATRLLTAIGTAGASEPGIQSLLAQLEHGEISVDTALEGLHQSITVHPQSEIHPRRGKSLHIRVERSEKNPINVRIPLGWVDKGLDLLPTDAIRVDGNPIDKQKLLMALRANVIGTLLEVDGDDGEHVVISIE